MISQSAISRSKRELFFFSDKGRFTANNTSRNLKRKSDDLFSNFQTKVLPCNFYPVNTLVLANFSEINSFCHRMSRIFSCESPLEYFSLMPLALSNAIFRFLVHFHFGSRSFSFIFNTSITLVLCCLMEITIANCA